MFSLSIMKLDLRINAKRLLIFAAVQTVSLLLAVGICEMRLIEISDIFWDTIPVILVPMLLEMVLAYEAVTRRKADGTMELIFATGIRPQRIFRTKALFVMFSGIGLVLLGMVIGMASRVYRLTGEWDRGSYLMLNFGACCLQTLIGGYCFYIACRVDGLFAYLKAAVAVPAAMYVIYVVYYWMPRLFVLQYVTVFSFYRQAWYAQKAVPALVGCVILLAGGLLFFWLARERFLDREA